MTYNRVGSREGKKPSVVLKIDGPATGNAGLRQQGMTLVAGEMYKLSAYIKTNGFRSSNAMNADPNIHLVAMADLFEDQVLGSRERIKEIKPGQTRVNDEHCFTGFDGYKSVLACDIDVILIATSSRFQPEYLKAGTASRRGPKG